MLVGSTKYFSTMKSINHNPLAIVRGSDGKLCTLYQSAGKGQNLVKQDLVKSPTFDELG